MVDVVLVELVDELLELEDELFDELDDDELLDELELDDELLDEDELELDDDDEVLELPEPPLESVPPVSAMVRRLGSVGDEEPPQLVRASRRTQQRPMATPAESLRIGVRFMTFLLEPK